MERSPHDGGRVRAKREVSPKIKKLSKPVEDPTRAVFAGARARTLHADETTRALKIKARHMRDLMASRIAYESDLGVPPSKCHGTTRCRSRRLSKQLRNSTTSARASDPESDVNDRRDRGGWATGTLEERIESRACGVGEPEVVTAKLPPPWVHGCLHTNATANWEPADGQKNMDREDAHCTLRVERDLSERKSGAGVQRCADHVPAYRGAEGGMGSAPARHRQCCNGLFVRRRISRGYRRQGEAVDGGMELIGCAVGPSIVETEFVAGGFNGLSLTNAN
ncbi:hypothetical protein K438DRAFT_1941299 [Mycena galopus ATCC 62051]|nr:hypothetical protein K438DRAFT_1941299 [Mycena galopus ATCC 62051]